MQETILSKFKNFCDTARSKNFKLYYDETSTNTDPELHSLLSHATMSLEPPPQGKWRYVDVSKGTSEKTMLVTGQKMYLSQAVDKFTEEIERGTFNAKLKLYGMIFLKETDEDGNPLKLACHHDSDGGICLDILTVGGDDDTVWRNSFDAWFE